MKFKKRAFLNAGAHTPRVFQEHKHHIIARTVVTKILIILGLLYLIGGWGIAYGDSSVTIPASLSTADQTPIQSALLQPPSIKRIMDRGKLIVAMYHRNTPPFYYLDDQEELTGVDVHLIKGFARLLGVDVVFDRKKRSFNQVVMAVANREVDVAISKLSTTFWRAKRVRCTEPYILLHQGLLVNRLELAKQSKGRPHKEVIRNLEGKIGVIANSSYVDYAEKRFKKATVVEYPTWDEVVKAATSGEVVAAYRDEVEIKKIIRNSPDTTLHFLTVVLKDAKDPKAMMVAWDSPHLLALFNFYIRFLDLNLTANKVLDHYNEVISMIQTRTQR